MRKKHPRALDGTEAPRNETDPAASPEQVPPRPSRPSRPRDNPQPELEGLSPDQGGGGQGAEGEGGAAKKNRSRRRRQRRNEAKRLAQASGGEGQAPVEGGDPAFPAPSVPQRPQVQADRPRREGQAPRKANQGNQGGRRQDGQGGPRQDAQGRGPRGDRAPGGQQQRRQGQPRPDIRSGGQPRPEGQRRSPSREAWAEKREQRGQRRPPQEQRQTYPRPEFEGGFTRRSPQEHPFGESIIPPPEVIAAMEGGNFQPASMFRNHSRGKSAPIARVLETLSPSVEALAVMGALQGAIEDAAPLQPKHRAGLRGDIRALWEELTSERESRSADYLGTPPALSAYLRYFLPWNVYRLASIFSNADFCLPDKAVVVDIGSGPLTLPIALYASRPELRDVPLTIYCVDRVERVMEAGLAIFEILCMRIEGRLPPWKLVLRKEGFGSALPEKAHLLSAANVFNEFFWKEKGSLGERALDTARTLLSYLRENGSLFVMEPGDPRSGAFITSLRAALAAEGASPLGPCPHALSCPMPGIYRHLLPPEETRTVKGDPNAAPSRFVLPPVIMPKKRDKFPWCHFGVDTDQAPKWLLDLSVEAGLPKERAVLSYLWAARGASSRMPAGLIDPLHHSEKEKRARAGRGILVRVVSEPFALPDGSSGQYACSSLGYTLLKRPRGEESFEPGDLLEVAASPMQRNDEKSGAIILPT